MAVFRIEKTRDYTVMANHHLRNTALSLKAKGLLSLMLSLPEDWDYTTKGLARICRDGVDSICATVRELEDAGYIIRERVRNANGRLGSIEYTILEQPRPPEPKPGKPERENPVQVKPVLDSPVLGKPEQENPAQLNTKGSSKQISNTDSSSTEESNPIQSSPQTPTGVSRTGRDWMRERENYRELILENIEYDYLCRDDRLDRDKIVLFRKEKYHHVRLALEGAEAVSDRIVSPEDAQAIRDACDGQRAVCVSLVREKKTEKPPKLYDLTTLQREANRVFGYTAKQTLDYAQSLYEKKLLTYPRTDSRHLTGDMAETASVVLHLAARVPPFDACPEFFPDVAALVNDKEVSDHHALIPTLELEKADVPALPVGERNILLLVCCKLLCAAAEPFVYEVVTAAFECGGYTFTAKGKQVLSQGWRAIQEVFRSSLKEKPEDEDAGGVLPALTEGQVFEPVTASVTEHFTSPPRPYTEDSLLAAMENAGKEDIPEDAERRGLGTPATRAAIIEKLVSGGFVERKGKNLIPTKAGVNLVTVLPELLTSPKLTADWEQRLNEVAKGQASPEDFMDGIEAMAAELVRKYSHISEDGQKLFQPEKETVGLCPRCGKQVYEGKKNFACSDRACQFVMWKNDRFWTSRRKEMTRKMAADLLKKGRTSVKGMWSEKKGSTYDAVVILDDTGGKYVNFKLEFPKRKDGVHGKK